jgi:hypothetical protein
MREFFRGWRRKAGCVTLTIALALTGVWVRSSAREDLWILIKGDASVGVVISKDGSLTWSQCYPIPEGPWRIEHTNVNPFPDPRGFPEQDLQWICRFGGNGAGMKVDEMSEISLRCAMIEYSFIVAPLTLLSAYLLLSKPKPKPLPATSEQPNT